MIAVIVIITLCAAAAVYFASVQHGICLRGLLVGSAVVALISAYLLFLAPGDTLLRYQQVYPRVFHPWSIGAGLFLAMVAFLSISLGLLARCLVSGRRGWWRGK